MIFSSIPFLYYFLPCVLVLYYIAPKRLKNGVLFLSSLVFYAWGEPKYVLLMVISILVSYLGGLGIEHFRGTIWSKVSFAVGTMVCLGFLVYYKYARFFLENCAKMTGMSVSALKIALPVGISFYTFQLISYLADVYRQTVPAQKNPVLLGTYITMFPQLIAGPIVRYSDVEAQLIHREHSYEKIALGIRRFVIGMAKKVLIANALGELCSHFLASEDLSVLYVWMYAIAFTLQIYFDFSGYSDMAIGLGKMFGFEFIENFDYPYVSRSVTEFWRRWHISLGRWFRDYVYIPLGGNRIPKWRWLCNIFIVWLLTGFWHGAAWNFILWGLYFAVLLLIEKLWLKPFLDKHPVVSHAYVMFLIILGFVIFNAVNVGVGLGQIGAMFGVGNLPLISAEALYYLRSYSIVFLLAIVGSTPIVKNIVSKVIDKSKRNDSKMDFMLNAAETILLLLSVIVMTAYFVDGSFNPFLYFRF